MLFVLIMEKDNRCDPRGVSKKRVELINAENMDQAYDIAKKVYQIDIHVVGGDLCKAIDLYEVKGSPFDCLKKLRGERNEMADAEHVETKKIIEELERKELKRLKTKYEC